MVQARIVRKGTGKRFHAITPHRNAVISMLWEQLKRILQKKFWKWLEKSLVLKLVTIELSGNFDPILLEGRKLTCKRPNKVECAMNKKIFFTFLNMI